MTGDQLRQRIRQLGLTYREAAERLGLTLAGLNHQMRGVHAVSRQTEIILAQLEREQSSHGRPRQSPKLPVTAGLALALFAATAPALAGEWFNWDRYHDRQDACREADRIAAACTQGYCDELALRQAQRACRHSRESGDERQPRPTVRSVRLLPAGDSRPPDRCASPRRSPAAEREVQAGKCCVDLSAIHRLWERELDSGERRVDFRLQHGRTPAQLKAAALQAQQGGTPEQRSESAKSAWRTRRGKPPP
jgi:hypothetical protein